MLSSDLQRPCGTMTNPLTLNWWSHDISTSVKLLRPNYFFDQIKLIYRCLFTIDAENSFLLTAFQKSTSYILKGTVDFILTGQN